MKKFVLVTGGTGYIGSHTAVELIEEGFEVVIVDNLVNSRIEVLDGIEQITGIRPHFEKFDLCDSIKIAELCKNSCLRRCYLSLRGYFDNGFKRKLRLLISRPF